MGEISLQNVIPYFCTQLTCVLNFSGGLALWQLYLQTNKQTNKNAGRESPVETETRMECKQTRLEEETAQQSLVREWSARLFLSA